MGISVCMHVWQRIEVLGLIEEEKELGFFSGDHWKINKVRWFVLQMKFGLGFMNLEYEYYVDMDIYIYTGPFGD